MLREFQSPAIFADGADRFFGEPIWRGRLDFDGDFNIGHELTNEVLNHLPRYLADITVHAGRVDFNSGVEPLGPRRLSKANGLTLQVRARVESFGLAVEAAKVLSAAAFVPTQAQKEFPPEQFTPVELDSIEEMDRKLVVAYGRKTAELNARARRFALRLSRAYEIGGPLEIRHLQSD